MTAATWSPDELAERPVPLKPSAVIDIEEEVGTRAQRSCDGFATNAARRHITGERSTANTWILISTRDKAVVPVPHATWQAVTTFDRIGFRTCRASGPQVLRQVSIRLAPRNRGSAFSHHQSGVRLPHEAGQDRGKHAQQHYDAEGRP